MDENGVINENLIFCIDYSQLVKREPSRVDLDAENVAELVHRNAQKKEVAAVFHAEKRKLTFQEIKVESDRLAAGFIAVGIKTCDRVLICGSNESQLLLTLLAAARAGFIFCLANPNFSSSEQLKRTLLLGDFKAIICFKAQVQQDHLYSLLMEIVPELLSCRRGKLKSAEIPSLTHVILTEEDHLHAGTFTLSEVSGRASAEKVAKLPNFEKWNQHDVTALQLTMGSTGEPQLVALSHYQLLGGARAVNHAFGIQKELRQSGGGTSTIPRPTAFPSLSLALPYQVPGAALRLLLKTCQMHSARLSSLEKILLIGERVPNELQFAIQKHANRVKIIAVGYLLTETGSVPVMGDQTCNLTKNVGKAITGYETRLEVIQGSSTMGELLISPFNHSTFLGYAPNFETQEWINTGDIAEIDDAGNIRIIAHKEDIIYDDAGRIFNHRPIERILALSPLVKGVQVISCGRGEPIVAVCALRGKTQDSTYLKQELVLHCRNTGIPIPSSFVFLEDFPRANTRIQKYKLRQWLKEGLLEAH